MPKRSNFFQHLMYLVRINLAKGARVFESKMMKDRLSGKYREVDIVIQGEVGSEQVIVSIECRDHKRPADVIWVDAMKAKHERLDTNVLMLASANGFSAEARQVAEKFNIQLLSLELLADPETVPSLPTKSELQSEKTISIAVNAVSARVSDTEAFVSLKANRKIYPKNTSETVEALDLIKIFLRLKPVHEVFFAYDEGDRDFELDIPIFDPDLELELMLREHSEK